MQYTVIVKRKHCIGNTYNDGLDCGLARAIKEQLPDLKSFQGVGGWFVSINHERWTFKEDPYTCDSGSWLHKWLEKEWGLFMFTKLRVGLIKEFAVTFTSPDHVEKQDAVKEAEHIITNHKIAEHEVYY